MIRVLLVGNPNCGKTTLFNALTGDHQRIGNWPGVTVEKKSGLSFYHDQEIHVTDLPGIYTLSSSSKETSQDAQIAAHAIAFGAATTDVIVNVIDACHLERHLYLTSQLLELGRPMILAINMMDIAEQRGIVMDKLALSQQLNCPIVMLQAHRQVGLSELQQCILTTKSSPKEFALALSPEMQRLQIRLEQELPSRCSDTLIIPYLARRLLEGDTCLLDSSNDLTIRGLLQSVEDIDLWMADARYRTVHELVLRVQKKRSDAKEHLTAKIDRIVLHRIWALPIFLMMMYLMFLFAMNVGGAFQDFFDITSSTIFVQGSAWILTKLHLPNSLIALVANGLGKGINTTLTFIPVIGSMFFFLALLETSGYMARAAFVVDRLMRAMGLPGKSFVPMIVGFGCNVPAILAARTLDSEYDRQLTVLMSPFMSCSARLAIYAIFVAAFFPTGGQNVVFLLYLIGILMAVITGWFLRKTMFHGQSSPLILELPAYHRPSMRRLLKETSLRLRYFIFRAGKVIIPACIVLGSLNALTIHGHISMGEASSDSILTLIGQWLTPLFSPMGLSQDNWPATVGLLSGMMAKEVVVGSLNTLYTQIGHLSVETLSKIDFLENMKMAFWSIPMNLSQIGSAFIHPMAASVPYGEIPDSVYGVMYQHFDGQAGAFAYLLFILLYIPCVSTMAAIRQETNKKLMWFSIFWSLLVAYASAVIFYQLATFKAHPEQSMIWLLGLTTLIAMTKGFLQRSMKIGVRHAVTNS